MKAILLTVIFGIGHLASAATCGSVDEAITTMREVNRQAAVSSKPAKISEASASQVLSALISAKLEDPKLTEQERQSLQEEHEAVCSGM